MAGFAALISLVAGQQFVLMAECPDKVGLKQNAINFSARLWDIWTYPRRKGKLIAMAI